MLEDGDILEMVNAGLVPATVVDNFMADLYTQVFPNLRKNSDIASPPSDIAWAFRKGSPKLAEAVNAFVNTHKQGSVAGNVLINKYVKTTKWVKNARSDEDRKRLQSMAELFRKYAKQYDLDYVLMAAQGYQESGLDQTKRSHVGAIGVMQVMPATARDKAVGIPGIDKLEDNIHAGIKYNRWVVDNFYADPGTTAPRQGTLRLRIVQRGSRQGCEPPQAGRGRGARSEQVVQQRGAGGSEADRPRDSDVREQHLQVLPGLPDDHPAICRASGGEGEGSEEVRPLQRLLKITLSTVIVAGYRRPCFMLRLAPRRGEL